MLFYDTTTFLTVFMLQLPLLQVPGPFSVFLKGQSCQGGLSAAAASPPAPSAQEIIDLTIEPQTPPPPSHGNFIDLTESMTSTSGPCHGQWEVIDLTENDNGNENSMAS